ncbi:MAG: T9SS type A sorting domain-containing protein, partial [Bacteroidota bacterium]
ALDDFKRGNISFPLENLNPGVHSLTLKVWDNHNNSVEETINFKVVETGTQAVSNLNSSPNPFSFSTKLSFFNQLVGEQIEINVGIYDASGKLVNEFYRNIANTTSNVDILEWNGYSSVGNKVKAGLYIFKVYINYPESNLDYNETTKVFFRN